MKLYLKILKYLYCIKLIKKIVINKNSNLFFSILIYNEKG